MKSIFVLAILLAFPSFAGGLHFEREYRGQFLGDEVILQVQPGSPDYSIKLTYVPRHQTVNGKMRFVTNSTWESVFELEVEGTSEKFKVVTVPPCAEIEKLTLVLPSSAQVLMTKN